MGCDTSWRRRVLDHLVLWQASRALWKNDMERFKQQQKDARKSGRAPDSMGPPPTGFALLPWLLMGMGSFSNLLQGKTPNPWIGGIGLLAFNSLYIYVTFRSFVKEKRQERSTRVALLLMALLTTGLAVGYGGNWLMFFPLLGLATGAVVRGPWLGRTGLALAAFAAGVAALRDGKDAVTIGYGTVRATMEAAAVLSLSGARPELYDARAESALPGVGADVLP